MKFDSTAEQWFSPEFGSAGFLPVLEILRQRDALTVWANEEAAAQGILEASADRLGTDLVAYANGDEIILFSVNEMETKIVYREDLFEVMTGKRDMCWAFRIVPQGDPKWFEWYQDRSVHHEGRSLTCCVTVESRSEGGKIIWILSLEGSSRVDYGDTLRFQMDTVLMRVDLLRGTRVERMPVSLQKHHAALVNEALNAVPREHLEVLGLPGEIEYNSNLEPFLVYEKQRKAPEFPILSGFKFRYASGEEGYTLDCVERDEGELERAFGCILGGLPWTAALRSGVPVRSGGGDDFGCVLDKIGDAVSALASYGQSLHMAVPAVRRILGE